LKLAPRCPSARSNPARCRAAAGLVYFIFDLLHLDGDDVGALPLIERKARLAALLSGVVPPLGFRAQDRKLVIVDSEAELIRSIFRRYAELAIDIRVHRVTAMGQLAASIAHEVNQAIAATVTNAQAALRWLDRRPADLEEAAGNDQVPAVCRRLFQHLEDRSQQAWADLLLPRSLDDLLLKRARDNWSEYSLYHLLAEHNKVLFDYHFLPSSEDSTRLRCQSSVWTKAHDRKRRPLATRALSDPVVARRSSLSRGTEGSNPSSSSGESGANSIPGSWLAPTGSDPKRVCGFSA